MTEDRSKWGQFLAALCLVLIALAAVVLLRTSSKSAPPRPRLVASMFQDDDHLLYSSTPVVTRTLNTLKGLGVNEVRATVLWSALAPGGAAPPAGFLATNPGAYPSASWVPYDRLVRLAESDGIAVDFNVTAPGPPWAMSPHPPAARYANHWAPSASRFGQFVQAVATRYSGHYLPASGGPALPRVSFWSIWNEPNQPGWLAPQWQAVSGVAAPSAAALYRAYVDAAWSGLQRAGHSPARDTILVGELAPEGPPQGSQLNYHTATSPLPFLRAVYCLDASYRPLAGSAAAALACPRNQGRQSFVAANPGLFQATGLGYHPYSFFQAPNVSLPNPNWAPLADLGRLEHALDASLGAYGVTRRLPLWLTEYGYETDPPNPFRGVSPRLQSLYLNEAQYMAFRDPRVRALSQFLLLDARPDTSYPPGTPQYWSTFQTGLMFANGTRKPSLNSYRLPLFVPDPVLGAGNRVLLWGMVRPAPADTRQRVLIEWRTQQSSVYRVIAATVAQPPGEVVIDRVRLPGPGVVRIEWTAPDGTVQDSRGVGVR